MRSEKVVPSLSPSMDIQISSNFERYLCDLTERDHDGLAALMDGFARTKSFSVGDELMGRARREFIARRCSDLDTLATMKECYRATGILIDPHTAVAMNGAAGVMAEDPAVPMVIMACAHPAKFPQAVKEATGILPPPEPRLAGLMKKEERFTVLPHDLLAVRQFVRNNAARH